MRIGRYDFTAYSRRLGERFPFGCTDTITGRGVLGCATPLTAWLRLRPHLDYEKHPIGARECPYTHATTSTWIDVEPCPCGRIASKPLRRRDLATA